MTKAPKMSRAHFKFLAGLLAEIEPTGAPVEHNQWAHTVRSLAVALTWTNDQFDRSKFEEACGL
jgi:hypothetical protein